MLNGIKMSCRKMYFLWNNNNHNNNKNYDELAKLLETKSLDV